MPTSLSTESQFTPADYCVFLLFLLISLFIGVFFAVKSFRRKVAANDEDDDDEIRKSGKLRSLRVEDDDDDDDAGREKAAAAKSAGKTNEFLLGNRNMPMLPVSLSILASFLSANTVMGTPGVIYQSGIIYWFFCLHNLISIPFAAHLFIPIFHDLQLTSVYEYLQLRFSFSVRLAASIIFVIQMLFYMAVVLYAPAIALQGVTGIKAWVSVLATGVVCTAYTVMGGLKAVVWTDVFQMIVVYAGLLTMLVVGVAQVGGIEVVFAAAANGSRLNADVFDPDPTVEYTLWSAIIGGAFTALTVYVSNQTLVQRYLSLRKLSQAQLALYLNCPLLILIVTITGLLGLVIFATFQGCDPIKADLLKSPDQLMAAMIPLTLGRLLPGLSGLFVACVFSASISTISSGVNSLAAICIEDFTKPLAKKYFVGRVLTDSLTVSISRILATLFGVLTIGLAFLVDNFGSSVVILALTVFGLCGGPLLGLFVQGVFCPWIEETGALVGVLASFFILLIIKVGALASNYKPASIPTSVEDCHLINVTLAPTNWTTTTTTMSTFPSLNVTSPSSSSSSSSSPDYIFPLFRLSFFWYALVAVVVAIVVGSIVSLACRRARKKIPADLLAPCWRKSRFAGDPTKRTTRCLVGAANQLCRGETTDV